jgi:hypothetical protein
VALARAEYATKAVAQRVLDAAFVFLECLLYPLMFEQLTAGGQEIVRKEKNCLGGSAEFWAFILGQSFRPGA